MTEIPIWSRTRDGLGLSDIPVREGGRVPDFCIIGAAKTATTTICGLLEQHPGIFVNPVKEPHFYATDQIYARGAQWNRGFYAEARDDQICGEASTSYTRFPLVHDVPDRMAADNPAMKLIYCVREPVARAKSQCLQVMKYSRKVLAIDLTQMSLDEILDETEHNEALRAGILEGCDYDAQLSEFERCFPPEQILIVFYEDFCADTPAFMAQLFDYLGLPGIALESTRLNATSDFLDRVSTEKGLQEVQKIPFYDQLKGLLPDSLKTRLKKRLGRGATVTYDFSAARKQALRERFAGPNARLRQRTGRDLPNWS
jgi:hypothetical protein